MRWQINTQLSRAVGNTPYFLAFGQTPRVGISALPLSRDLLATLATEADLAQGARPHFLGTLCCIITLSRFQPYAQTKSTQQITRIYTPYSRIQYAHGVNGQGRGCGGRARDFEPKKATM